MQTLEFTRALEEIVNELRVGELVLLLQKWLTPTAGSVAISDADKDNFQGLILSSHSGYDRLMRAEATRKIIEGLKLKEVFEASRLRRLVTALSGAPNSQSVRGITEFYGLYESLRSVLNLQATCRNLLEMEKLGKLEASEGILELEIIDYDGKGIEDTRLEKIISTLTQLHTNLARVLGIQNDKLRFSYFDSGSDVAVGITAAAGLIAVLGPLLLQFWDKTRFRRQDTFTKDMEALSKGLEFVTKVQEAVGRGALTDEDAKNLKARIFGGVDDLIGLGATLPLRGSTLDQRQLLIEKRDTKLLGTGEPSPPRDDAETPGRKVRRDD